ncbi:hypothetical protein Tco_0237982 [Tanacetum coccineum]
MSVRPAKPMNAINIKRFADGEIYIQLQESVRGCDVFLVRPTCPAANENIMELLVMIDDCRRALAKTVTAVILYFGYARADRKKIYEYDEIIHPSKRDACFARGLLDDDRIYLCSSRDIWLGIKEEIVPHDDIEHRQCQLLNNPDLEMRKRHIKNMILQDIDAILHTNGRYGGTGKTYVWKTLFAAFRCKGESAKCYSKFRFAALLRRYGVSVPALTKDHEGSMINTPYPEDQYAVLEIKKLRKQWQKNLEQYCGAKTETGYGVAGLKLKTHDNFELKGRFLKELRTNTFSGSDHKDANEHIEKGLEIVNLFHILNIFVDQVMLRAFLMSLTGAASHWLRNEPTSSNTTWMILDSRGAIPSKTAADAKVAIQEMDEYSQKWHNGTSRSRSTKTSDGLAAIQAQLNNLGREIKKVNEIVYAAQVGCKQCKGPHYTKDCPLKEEGKTLKEAYYTQFNGPFQGGGYKAAALGFYQRNNANPSKRHKENSNLIKEIRALMDAAIRNQGASIKTLEIQIGQMNKVLQERGFGSLPSSTEANPRDQVKSILTTIEADSYPIRRIGSNQYAVSTRQNQTLMYETRQTTIPFPRCLNGYYCEEKKGSYGPQFLEAHSEASHINNSIPRKEKVPRSFTL